MRINHGRVHRACGSLSRVSVTSGTRPSSDRCRAAGIGGDVEFATVLSVR
ncbi:hypothetical protein Pd630_LPD04507 [Rhodococcus opacus PD630]|nr:hypothetical protein Pd630_LPD04507 [Rhodococcus opacus PD630]